MQQLFEDLIHIDAGQNQPLEIYQRKITYETCTLTLLRMDDDAESLLPRVIPKLELLGNVKRRTEKVYVYNTSSTHGLIKTRSVGKMRKTISV